MQETGYSRTSSLLVSASGCSRHGCAGLRHWARNLLPVRGPCLSAFPKLINLARRVWMMRVYMAPWPGNGWRIGLSLSQHSSPAHPEAAVLVIKVRGWEPGCTTSPQDLRVPHNQSRGCTRPLAPKKYVTSFQANAYWGGVDGSSFGYADLPYHQLLSHSWASDSWLINE
jgi:hypothetical protein